MIPRYTREAMGRLFTDEARMGLWLRVELAATEVLARRGEVPHAAWEAIRDKARVDVARALEIEATTQHDVIAFVTSVAERIGPEGRYLHLGLTSSDVLDTALALQIVGAIDLLLVDLDELLAAVRARAEEHCELPMVGRTHGVHAEPITLGLKIASWYAELARGRERLLRARENVRYGKLSGAVGTFAQLPPEVEQAVMAKLGLNCEPVSTQVVPRDRHAEVLLALALLAAGLERMATEVRHLQRTEVREVEEPFAKGQKGSSAMPHKRNPIACENVSGLARVVRSNALAALQDVALWHERDISHSSVERVIIPDSFVLLDYMLGRMTRVVSGLLVYPEAMQENLDRSRGMVFSQTLLLALVGTGLTREEAYALVQENAMKVWAKEHPDLLSACSSDARIVQRLDPSAIRAAFDTKRLLEHVPAVVRRALDPGRS
ncbi:MAG: adenylosuccinate lyase [Acidobacteria bacterium]|jgi:adenylosuccinate lyase|nr:adenylosuccinate lyase [Acidobacteriota bacterium]